MIDFGTYKYVGNVDKSKPESYYRYNDSYYRDLLANNRYQDAAAYASNYVLTDKEANAKLHNDIETYRTHGKIVEAVYKKIEDPVVLRSIEESDNIGVPGGYQRLRNRKDASGNLIYKTDEEFFADYPLMKRQHDLLVSVGSSKDREATSFSLTFSNYKAGLFGINEFAKDNNDNLDYFLNNLNMSSINELRDKIGKENVIFNETTGETTIHINKNHELAIPALLSIKYQGRDANKVLIKGYDKNGEIKRESYANGTDFFESNLWSPEKISDSMHNGPFGNLYLKQKYSHTSVGDFNDAIAFGTAVYNAHKNKLDLFKKEEYNTLLMSSSTFDLTDDRLARLDKALELGKITPQEYEKRKNQEINDWPDRLRGLPYLYGMQANLNSKKGDNSFSTITNEDYNKIQEELSHYKNSDVIVQGMTINGEIGVLMTLPQLATTQTHVTNDDNKTTLFIPASAIPGALGELQTKINNDTHLKAEKDYTDMLNWRVKHKLLDGSTISTNGNEIIKEVNGRFISISKDDAIRDLDRDIILRRAKYKKFNDISKNGKLNDEKFSIEVKNMMIAALYDMYPNLRFADVNGNEFGRDISYNSIFDDNYYNLINEDNYSEPVLYALSDIRNMYNYLVNDAYTYIKENY